MSTIMHAQYAFHDEPFMARHAVSYILNVNYPHFLTDQIVAISASATSSIKYQ